MLPYCPAVLTLLVLSFPQKVCQSMFEVRNYWISTLNKGSCWLYNLVHYIQIYAMSETIVKKKELNQR